MKTLHQKHSWATSSCKVSDLSRPVRMPCVCLFFCRDREQPKQMCRFTQPSCTDLAPARVCAACSLFFFFSERLYCANTPPRRLRCHIFMSAVTCSPPFCWSAGCQPRAHVSGGCYDTAAWQTRSWRAILQHDGWKNILFYTKKANQLPSCRKKPRNEMVSSPGKIKQIKKDQEDKAATIYLMLKTLAWMLHLL